MAQKECPLSDEHCAILDRVLRSCSELRALLEQCKQCKMDVSEAAEQNDEHEALAKALKSTFFPDRI